MSNAVWSVRSAARSRLLAVLVAVAAMFMTVSFGAGSSEAGIRTVKVLSGSGIDYVNVRTAPAASGAVIRRIPAGASVGINCWSAGQSVTGPYGASTIWYTIDGGGYVTDAYLYTGSNSAVTPQCASSAATPSQRASTGRAWGRATSRNNGYAGYCTWGALQSFRDYTGVYPAISGNARDYYNSARAAGWSTSLDAQVNSIVVFQPGVQGGDRTYGHAGWVDQVQRRGSALYVHVVEMNAGAGFNRWSSRWLQDVRGMSYVLAPHR